MKGDFSMNPIKLIFKIVALPFVLVLTIIAPFFTFLFCTASVLLNIACGVGVLVSIALFFAGTTQGCIVFLILSFLISPLGIPAIAEWLIDRLQSLNYSLRDFIMS